MLCFAARPRRGPAPSRSGAERSKAFPAEPGGAFETRARVVSVGLAARKTRPVLLARYREHARVTVARGPTEASPASRRSIASHKAPKGYAKRTSRKAPKRRFLSDRQTLDRDSRCALKMQSVLRTDVRVPGRPHASLRFAIFTISTFRDATQKVFVGSRLSTLDAFFRRFRRPGRALSGLTTWTAPPPPFRTAPLPPRTRRARPPAAARGAP